MPNVDEAGTKPLVAAAGFALGLWVLGGLGGYGGVLLRTLVQNCTNCMNCITKIACQVQGGVSPSFVILTNVSAELGNAQRHPTPNQHYPHGLLQPLLCAIRHEQARNNKRDKHTRRGTCV